MSLDVNILFPYPQPNPLPKHDAKALEWFRKAAEQGHADAKVFLENAQQGSKPGKPWESFKNVPFGAPESYAKTIIPSLNCKNYDYNTTFVISDESHYADRVCYDNTFQSIGEAYVEHHSFLFAKNRLFIVELKLIHRTPGYIKNIFIAKYGKPHDTKTQRSNAVKTEILSWKSNKVNLILADSNLYGSDSGAAIFTCVHVQKEIEKATQAEKEKAVSGF